MVNGIPIVGHQGAGSITDITVRRILTLQGSMQPNQLITLMNYPGVSYAWAQSDHADHIHVGFQPMFGDGAKLRRTQLGAQTGPVGEADRPAQPHRRAGRPDEAVALRAPGGARALEVLCLRRQDAACHERFRSRRG